MILNEQLEVVQGAFYRQEILNLGESACPTGGESACDRVFSEYAVAEGSSIFIEDIVLDIETNILTREAREDEIDPNQPFTIEILPSDPEEELFFQIEVSDFYENTIRQNGFSKRPEGL